MTQLIPVANIDQEITVDPATGHGTATIRGTARIVGVSHVALSKHFQSVVTSNASKLAQTLLDCGFYPGDFASNGVPDTAVATITHYYACEANNPTTEAKIANLIFSAKGARDWMREVKGWREQLNQTQLFSHRNYELAKEIGEKAKHLAAENYSMSQRIQELEARLAKLQAPALPPSDGMRLKELLRCCGVTIDSTDGNMFSRIALDIRKAVETGDLPKDALAGKGRYRYIAAIHAWVKAWLMRHQPSI